MTQPDFDLLTFIKDFVWAPLLALVGWAWHRNERAHEMLWEKHDAVRKDASTGHSVLNDRITEYVDTAVDEVKSEQRRRTDKLAEHIERLFQNAETDRKDFAKVMADHREDSYKRHIELLNTINAKVGK